MSMYHQENIDKYVESGGARCPECGSDEIEGDSFVSGGGEASQEMWCLDCDASWEDVHVLSSIR
jgi:hypothetical protein